MALIHIPLPLSFIPLPHGQQGLGRSAQRNPGCSGRAAHCGLVRQAGSGAQSGLCRSELGAGTPGSPSPAAVRTRSSWRQPPPGPGRRGRESTYGRPRASAGTPTAGTAPAQGEGLGRTRRSSPAAPAARRRPKGLFCYQPPPPGVRAGAPVSPLPGSLLTRALLPQADVLQGQTPAPSAVLPRTPRLCLPAASRHSDTATRTRKTFVVITGKPRRWLGQCCNCQQRR